MTPKAPAERGEACTENRGHIQSGFVFDHFLFQATGRLSDHGIDQAIGDFHIGETAGPRFGLKASQILRHRTLALAIFRLWMIVEALASLTTKTPIIGAVQGAAIGGGLGLCLVPDFRVAAPEARFAANFTRLGFHPGFGLTHTLPALIGQQRANLMFYTSRRIKGEEAVAWGLADMLVPLAEVRGAAQALAAEIAENSPLGVRETRATMRQGLADAVRKATDHELVVQNELRQTEDFKEGIRAVGERRVPNFTGA